MDVDVKTHLRRALEAIDWGDEYLEIGNIAEALRHVISAVDGLDDRK